MIAATVLAAVVAAQIQGAPPVYHEIKDWIVACDNTRACFAKYVPADDGAGGMGYFSIARDPGPAGQVTVTLMLTDAEGSPDPKNLRLDGKPIGGALPWKLDTGEGQSATLKGAPAVQFIDAIRDGKTLAFWTGSPDAPVLSLSGMTAALLAMDDDQGRLDGATALIRRGAKPASAVPAAPAVPIVRAKPTPDKLPNAKALIAGVRSSQAAVLRPHECQAKAKEIDEAHALSPTEALVMLGCIQAAYQDSVVVFRTPRNDPAKARLAVMPLEPTADPKNITAENLGEYVGGEWDEKTATFSESSKGRGLADCGTSSAWTFDGTSFVLSSYAAQIRCGGGPGGDWPTLYRSRVVTR